MRGGKIMNNCQYSDLKNPDGLDRLHLPEGGCPKHRDGIRLICYIEHTDEFHYLKTSLLVQQAIIHLLCDKCLKCRNLLSNTLRIFEAFEPIRY